MKLVDLVIEEYEVGTWVANAVSLEAFDGDLSFGELSWSGAKVSESFEQERYRTTIVGGAGNLGVTLLDKFYTGRVSLQTAVQDACREASEAFGSAVAGSFLSTFERLKGTLAQSLDALANAFALVWWIDRDGNLQMQAARDVGPEATGQRVSVASDSVLLVNPVDVQVGGTYEGKTIRHVRWSYNAERFAAEIYFLPFVYRAPVDKRYASLESARVDRDNGDGTIDVIVGARYGLTKVPLFCGVPGSKVQVRGGEEVSVGYFGGDPQKPYAVSMAQNTAATKQVARKGDTVGAGTLAFAFVPGSGAASLSVTYTPGDGGAPQVIASGSGTITIGEKITSGSDRLKVGD